MKGVNTMIYGQSYNLFNRKMTEIAQPYLAEGYIINTDTMSRNEIDLRKGKHFVRIWVDRESSYRFDKALEKEGYWGDIYFIKVGSTTLQNPNTDTVWNDRLDVFSTKMYYEVGRWNSHKAYTDSREEALQCAKKASKRSEYRYGYSYRKTYKDINRLKVAFNFIKKLPQTKSIHLEHVDEVRKEYNDNRTRYWYYVQWHTTSGITKTAKLNWKKTF